MQNSFALDKRDDAELLEACGERGIAFVPFFAIAGAHREDGAGPSTLPVSRGWLARTASAAHDGGVYRPSIAVQPPSTISWLPVTNDEASEAR